MRIRIIQKKMQKTVLKQGVQIKVFDIDTYRKHGDFGEDSHFRSLKCYRAC